MAKRPVKLLWEREGGAPHLYNKGPVSQAMRNIADAVLFEAQRGDCVLCGKPLTWPYISRDHVWPASKGGDHSIYNCRLAHQACNIERANRSLDAEQRLRVDTAGVSMMKLLKLLVAPATLDRGPDQMKGDDNA